MEIETMKARIGGRVIKEIDFTEELSGEEMYRIIDDIITSDPERKNLSIDEVLTLRREVYNSIKKYDVIQEFLDDESVTEPFTQIKIPANSPILRAFWA